MSLIDKIKTLGAVVGIVGVPLLGISILLGIGTLYNRRMNNRVIDKPAYHLVSQAVGISGHTEYIKYSDGSQEVRKFHPLGNTLFPSELSQDLDGDGVVDRIRKDAGDFKMRRLNDVLIRQYDYQANKKIFDGADRELRKLVLFSDYSFSK